MPWNGSRVGTLGADPSSSCLIIWVPQKFRISSSGRLEVRNESEGLLDTIFRWVVVVVLLLPAMDLLVLPCVLDETTFQDNDEDITKRDVMVKNKSNFEPAVPLFEVVIILNILKGWWWCVLWKEKESIAGFRVIILSLGIIISIRQAGKQTNKQAGKKEYRMVHDDPKVWTSYFKMVIIVLQESSTNIILL